MTDDKDNEAKGTEARGLSIGFELFPREERGMGGPSSERWQCRQVRLMKFITWEGWHCNNETRFQLGEAVKSYSGAAD